MRKTGEGPILAVRADEGPPEPRRGAPVHEPGVVVRIVLPERVELDAPAAEDRSEVAPGERPREGRRREEEASYPIVERVRLCAGNANHTIISLPTNTALCLSAS